MAGTSRPAAATLPKSSGVVRAMAGNLIIADVLLDNDALPSRPA